MAALFPAPRGRTGSGDDPHARTVGCRGRGDRLISAHATSAPVGDITELRSIKRVQACDAASHQGAKSMLGHTCWAAPTVESVTAILQMHAGRLHPSISIDVLDPEADLDICRRTSAPCDIRCIIKMPSASAARQRRANGHRRRCRRRGPGTVQRPAGRAARPGHHRRSRRFLHRQHHAPLCGAPTTRSLTLSVCELPERVSGDKATTPRATRSGALPPQRPSRNLPAQKQAGRITCVSPPLPPRARPSSSPPPHTRSRSGSAPARRAR